MKYVFIVMLFLLVREAWAMDAGFELPATIKKQVEDGVENRKSPCTVIVSSKTGKPLAGAKIEIKQTDSEFLFGCAFPSWDIEKQQPNPTDWEQFSKYFLKLFNYSTTENMLKWQYMEYEEGKPWWNTADHFVRWANRNNVRVKGHCLVWGTTNGGYPAWLEGRTKDEVAKITKRHIQQVVGRYRGKIEYWDVINEAFHLKWFEEHFGPNYISDSLKWAREADPKAKLLINEYGNQWHGQASKFVEFCEAAVKEDAPLDAIGEQAHDAPSLPGPAEILDMLDTLGKLNRDVHVTEFTWPSNDAVINSTFIKGKWDERTQAKFYRYYYTIAFSHPKVKAITLWALWDGASWLKQGGIISKDWRLKPAYIELDNMINKEWRTNLVGRTNGNGSYKFRGFRGSYQITVTSSEGTTTQKVNITDKDNIVRMDFRSP